MENGVFDTLLQRGYIAGHSEPVEEVRKLLTCGTVFYEGVDPTSSSLHVGHLESLMGFHHLQQAGNQGILLIGGATALVGDPSGRDTGRPLLPLEVVQANGQSIRQQVESMGLISFQESGSGLPPALLLNNADWLDMSLITYLRDVTTYFSVNQMVKRETFECRLEDEQPLSLFEFLYPTLQAYDFLYLFDHYDCRLQMGGKDQWGNIMDGIELVHRKRGERLHALVFPLLLDRSGQKMGKTSTGQTVWLSAERTSPFDFYQYWLACPEADLKRNLQIFTLLSQDQIEGILQGHPRKTQHRLAFEVTAIVHGAETAERAQQDAWAAFRPGDRVPEQVPTLKITSEELRTGLTIVQAMRRAQVIPSLGAGRRLVIQGGVRVNGAKLSQGDRPLSSEDFRERDGELAALVQHGRGKVVKLVLIR